LQEFFPPVQGVGVVSRSTRVGSYTCKIKFASSQGEAGKLTCTASGRRKVTAIGSP